MKIRKGPGPRAGYRTSGHDNTRLAKATATPNRRARITIAMAVGVACAWGSHLMYDGNGSALNGGDFGYAWRAARWLMLGESPYARMNPAAPYGVGGPLLYPLPSALVALPFAGLPVHAAATAFIGVSAALLAYGLTSGGWLRLVAMLSPPFLFSIQTANWPPLVAASALLPGLGWLAVAKPNLGAVALAYAPRRAALGGAVALVGISLLVLPSWPFEWFTHLRQQPTPHLPALFWPVGAAGLLGLLRWRTPEGRALAALTVVPTASWPYDWLLLSLCARSGTETGVLTAAMWSAWLVILAMAPANLASAWTGAHLVLALGWILPATWLVLRRPNRGTLPDVIERASRRLPCWLRGSPLVAPAAES